MIDSKAVDAAIADFPGLHLDIQRQVLCLGQIHTCVGRAHRIGQTAIAYENTLELEPNSTNVHTWLDEIQS